MPAGPGQVWSGRRQAEQDGERRSGGQRAASQGSQHQTQDGPGNCGTSLLPGILCQDMPLKDRGRRGLVSHEGTDPKRKQEGGDRETGG